MHCLAKMRLEGFENGYIKGLKCVCGVGRKTKQNDVVASQIDYIEGEMACMAINKEKHRTP